MMALAAVQDRSGRELAAWKGEVADLSEIVAEAVDGRLVLSVGGAEVQAVHLDPMPEASLYVWDAGDKLSAPLYEAELAQTDVIQGEIVEEPVREA